MERRCLFFSQRRTFHHPSAMSAKCRYCCRSRKSDDAENLAKIDSELSLRLQPSLAPYEGRWSCFCETMWSLTSPRAKRISGPKKFRSSPQKDFFNTIDHQRTLHLSNDLGQHYTYL